jgi:regulator of protease activity HflC (stomatin/prohibitin superfamily)
MDFMSLIVWAIVATIAFAFISSMVVITGGKTAKILETFGKPHARARLPGMSFKAPWPITSVVGKVDLRQTEESDMVQVRAKDNAFVGLPVTVQLKAIGTPEGAVMAHYELDESAKQIMSYVLKEVKDAGAELSSEEMYSNRTKIKDDVIGALDERVRGFGYELVDILVDEPKLSSEMQNAFEEVKSSEMLKNAAQNKADAKRIELVGIAEAEKESQKLKGEGISNMREAIAKGIKKATDTMKDAGFSTDQSLELIIETNRMDTMGSVAAHGNLVLMDMNKLSGNTMAEMMAANKATATPVTSVPEVGETASEQG